MSRSHRSVLFVVVIVSLVISSVPAAPAQAVGPTASRDAQAETWLDLSFTAWIDSLVGRWFGGGAEPTEAVSSTGAMDDGPARMFDRVGSSFDPDGAYETGTIPEGDEEETRIEAGPEMP